MAYEFPYVVYAGLTHNLAFSKRLRMAAEDA